MYRIVIVMASLFLSLSIVYAQQQNSQDQSQSQGESKIQPVKEDEKVKDYHDVIESFFNLVNNQQFDQAAENLFADILISKSPEVGNKSYFDDVKAKLINLPKVYGKYCHHSRMFERMVAQRFVFVDYIVMFEKQPVEISFQFYKPKEKWMLYGFSIDEDIVNTMEKKIRDKMLISDPKPKV